MKVNRLFSITLLLIEKKRVTAKELADIFEVSTRTIYRDIDSITMTGIPIYSTPGVGGGFEIMENYKFDKNTFTEAEINKLLIGISNLPNLMKDKECINVVTKLKNLIPEVKIETTNIQTEQLSIDYDPWMGVKNLDPYLKIIKVALQEKKLIFFDYINHRGIKTGRQVEPYQFILKNNQWYFQGYCLARNDFRLFKVTRLLNLKIEPITFSPREYQKPFLTISETFEKIQTKIKLRIHKSIMERLLDHCDFDSFLFDDENHYVVQFPFIENDYYYNILLSFGECCECLEPLHIRLELKKKIARLAKVYVD